ncbi:hypothetical protein GUJ93_ZPchr0064g2743 [Zizania palustris]|uniref:Uncharacterized protein n=1 Tax=Zizania palustris TaxID=103762 RepID=A0A8J5V0C1_ZIZPA|nr:hypothetical protein GUJ93_ZPchr0103g7155 [Zizania palustris]KAG8044505.1 hypothetical protein GUJ93_ZPchr0064g2743 [Zizania palustris]
MSPFKSTVSLAYHNYSCHAMSCLSSHVPPKWQLKLSAAATALLLVVFLALFVGSCEARCLRARGSGKEVSSIKSSSPPAPCKDVEITKLKNYNPTNQMKDLPNSMDGHVVGADVKAEEGVAMAASSTGAVQTKTVVRVSKRLIHQVKREEDAGFHLDYAGPRTHPPSHN